MFLRLADLLLVLHFAFIVFVVAGQVAIVAGGLRGWDWVRKVRFRVAHLIAISIVVAQVWLGALCPLTAWENALRRAGGEEAYNGTFIEHWIGRLVYFDLPGWVFTAAYTLFGAVVLASWFLVPPRRRGT